MRVNYLGQFGSPWFGTSPNRAALPQNCFSRVVVEFNYMHLLHGYRVFEGVDDNSSATNEKAAPGFWRDTVRNEDRDAVDETIRPGHSHSSWGHSLITTPGCDVYIQHFACSHG